MTRSEGRCVCGPSPPCLPNTSADRLTYFEAEWPGGGDDAGEDAEEEEEEKKQKDEPVKSLADTAAEIKQRYGVAEAVHGVGCESTGARPTHFLYDDLFRFTEVCALAADERIKKSEVQFGRVSSHFVQRQSHPPHPPLARRRQTWRSKTPALRFSATKCSQQVHKQIRGSTPPGTRIDRARAHLTSKILPDLESEKIKLLRLKVAQKPVKDDLQAAEDSLEDTKKTLEVRRGWRLNLSHELSITNHQINPNPTRTCFLSAAREPGTRQSR